MPAPIRAGPLDQARPLRIAPKGRAEGEVMQRRLACDGREEVAIDLPP
jgi:hypothetical protein